MMPGRKLVVLTNIPTPYRDSFFEMLDRELESRGFSFKVFFCAESEPNRHWIFGSKSFRFSFKIMAGLSLRVRDVSYHFNPSIIFHLLKERPSVLLCAGSWCNPTVFLAALFAKLLGVKAVFWSEGHRDAVRNQRGVIAKVRRFVMRRFDEFAVPNQRSEDWILEHMRSNARPVIVHRLPNTVDEKFYIDAINLDPDLSRKELGIPRDTKVFVQISQLEGRKGVVQLAEAFVRVGETITEPAMLVFLGAGSEREKLDVIAKNNRGRVKVVGHVDSVEVRKWLRIADWFVLNTKLDPNPLTPIEAAFTRTPLLLSVLAGNFHEVCGTEAGVPIGDTNCPDEPLLCALAMSKEDAQQMGRWGYDNAKAQFSRDRVVANLVNSLFGHSG